MNDSTSAPEPHANPPPDQSRFTWTLAQRRAVLVLLTLLLGLLLYRFVGNPAYVSDPQPEHPARYQLLADRIDPNTAGLNELIALPMLGEKRAIAIIEFREKQRSIGRPEPIFHTVEDLLAVKGIGPATVDTLQPYFIFPVARPGMERSPR